MTLFAGWDGGVLGRPDMRIDGSIAKRFLMPRITNYPLPKHSLITLTAFRFVQTRATWCASALKSLCVGWGGGGREWREGVAGGGAANKWFDDTKKRDRCF